MQKALLKKLDLERFYFLNPLWKFFEDENSETQKVTLREFLKELPDKLNLIKTQEKLRENPKLGLFITDAIILFLESDFSNSTLITKQNAGLLYWMIDSPMETKNKELFRETTHRMHILEQYKKIHLTLKVATSSELKYSGDFKQKGEQIGLNERTEKRPDAKRHRKYSSSDVDSENEIDSTPQKKVEIQRESAINDKE